jgi:hypothetical protein
VIVAFRQYTLLPLDGCLPGLQPTILHLTRSSLHRCLGRHGISRLPEMEGDKPTAKRFADYEIGYFHIDIAEVRTEEGKLYLLSQCTEPRSLPSPSRRRKPTDTRGQTSCGPWSRLSLSSASDSLPALTCWAARAFAFRARAAPSMGYLCLRRANLLSGSSSRSLVVSFAMFGAVRSGVPALKP